MLTVEQLYGMLPKEMLQVLRRVEEWSAHVENCRDECAEISLVMLRDDQAELAAWQQHQEARDLQTTESIEATRRLHEQAKEMRERERPVLRLVTLEVGEDEDEA